MSVPLATDRLQEATPNPELDCTSSVHGCGMHQGYSLYHSKQDLHYDKGTWHAHSYSKPPARPTPHFIEDILGLKSRRADQAKEEVRDDMMVDEQMNVSCNRTSKQKTKCKSRIKCPVADNNRVPGGGKAKTPPSLKGPKKELHAKTGGGETKKKKKARTTFTGRQIWELENTFKDKKYLTAAERNDLAQLLNVTDNQVKIWFQNRRTKWKKHVSSKNEVLPKGKNNNEKTYDLKESYTSDGHADGDDGSVSADEGSDSKLESASCSGEDEID